jgi:hypothetical protein
MQSTAPNHSCFPPYHAAILRFMNLAFDYGLGMREHSIRLMLVC